MYIYYTYNANIAYRNVLFDYLNEGKKHHGGEP